MRTFFILFGLLVVGLIVGFLPRPLIKPDWKTPYDKALAEGDCTTVERIVDLLLIVGLDADGYREVYDNARNRKCKFVDSDEESIRRAEILGGLSEVNSATTKIDWQTSLVGRHFFYWNRKKFKTNAVVKKSERRLYSMLRECRNKFGAGYGGWPNYELLSYALKNPDLGASVVSDIAREQRASCVRSLVGELKVIETAATTVEDFATIASVTSGVWLIAGNAAPEASEMLWRLSESIPDEAFHLHGYVLEKDELVFPAPESCQQSLFISTLPSWAMACSADAQEKLDDQAYTPFFAVFYARRAARLGWRDVRMAELEAKSRLSAECFDALVALEAEAAGQETDPRDFKDLEWPVRPGEACDLEVAAAQQPALPSRP